LRTNSLGTWVTMPLSLTIKEGGGRALSGCPQ
jgi:hypothetical protein